MALLNQAEMLIRHLGGILVALLPTRLHRDVWYQFEYDLIRASGVGVWSQAVQKIVVGNLHSTVVEEARRAELDIVQVSQKVQEDDWRFSLVAALRESLALIGEDGGECPVEIEEVC